MSWWWCSNRIGEHAVQWYTISWERASKEGRSCDSTSLPYFVFFFKIFPPLAASLPLQNLPKWPPKNSLEKMAVSNPSCETTSSLFHKIRDFFVNKERLLSQNGRLFFPTKKEKTLIPSSRHDSVCEENEDVKWTQKANNETNDPLNQAF